MQRLSGVLRRIDDLDLGGGAEQLDVGGAAARGDALLENDGALAQRESFTLEGAALDESGAKVLEFAGCNDHASAARARHSRRVAVSKRGARKPIADASFFCCRAVRRSGQK